MELFNLLTTDISVFGQTFDVSLNWIGQLIRWLCNGVGVVGVGIILFSLALKLITMPFDVFQRISMRKQNIQMKANQERMEKLQKQYANDKETYNKKLMEMYKENGISLFSSCLPMILSMVIFIVAINAFNAYAQYSNIENYNTMVNAYNAEIKQYTTLLTEENYDDLVTEAVDADGKTVSFTIQDDTAGKFVYYVAKLDKEAKPEYSSMTVADKVEYVNSYPTQIYKVDEDRAVIENEEIAAYVAAHTDIEKGAAVVEYMTDKAQKAVQTAYDTKVKKHTGFLWIKNIWVTDAMYKNPVLSAADFKTEAKREEFEVDGKDVKYSKIQQYTNAYTTDAYEKVTAELKAEKKAYNGYFVLVALSIGTILLQQFIMQRSQKEQQKYSSVDGSSASQQKMTMFMMTGMFAIFSFMYSSAFSIYMITSNVFSMLSTLVINLFVDRSAKKKEEKVEITKQDYASERIEKAKQAGIEAAKESKKKNK